MAAILCQGIANLCKALGSCCSLPCQLCGSCCGESCRLVGQLFSSPFTPYLLTTLALNVPPFVFGTKAFIEAKGARCHGDVWLWVNAGLAMIHILAAIYIVHRVQEEKVTAAEATVVTDTETPTATAGQYQSLKENDNRQNTPAPVSTQQQSMTDRLLMGVVSTMAPSLARTAPAEPRAAATRVSSAPTNMATATYLGNDYDDGEANSYQRLKQVFCYDLVVAIYMVAAIFWCIWQSIGISQILFPEDDNNGNAVDVCEHIGGWTVSSIICGFLFIALVCFSFTCSLLCLRR